MPELDRSAEMSFSNPILIDIFSHYADNSTMAGFVGEDGMIRLRFRTAEDFEAPKGCEQILSLLYALLESNPELPMGRIYAEHQREILRETIYRLFMVLDGFNNVKLSVTVKAPDSDNSTRTEYTLTRTKTIENN